MSATAAPTRVLTVWLDDKTRGNAFAWRLTIKQPGFVQVLKLAAIDQDCSLAQALALVPTIVLDVTPTATWETTSPTSATTEV